LAAPLNNLTKKETMFDFKAVYKEAFKELKRLLIEAPILVFHDPERESVLETDASDFVISRILT
jgi:hypothetical protein